jgi:hypothetical protein
MTTAATTRTVVDSPSLSRATTVGSVLLALGSLGYIAAGVLTGGEAGRDGYLHPLNAPASGLAALGATILALTLAAWRPHLPRWATQAAAAGMVFIAAGAWASATITVAVAQHLTENEEFLDLGSSGWALAFFAPKAIHVVAFSALAVTGWRTGEIPRAACVLLGIGAILAVLPPFPPGAILASVAFFLIARGPMRT